MYLCGPTVYKPAHIGHMVGPVVFDTVKRYLTYNGYQVKFVINITDVDDKLINRARENKTTVEALARQMTQDYFDNLALVGVDTVDEFPYATQHIAGMQTIIGRLIEKGFAYPLDGDVYFEVTKDPDYGKLSRRSVEEMLAGRASKPTTANATRPISPCGKNRSRASRPGTAPGGGDALAGTSSARR